MRIHRAVLLSGLSVLASLVSSVPIATAQNAAPRITEAVDNEKRVTLRGNTHPLARPEYDRGIAPDSLPMERMLLVLTRSPEQEVALRALLDEQQDKSSPNFHRWLTPEQFGQRFGPADADIQAVTGWLSSQGFRVNSVAKGRTVIDFSGDAGLVRNAFHTQIHKYVVNGEEHWANASDPQIPVALAPVVAGVATLHNFYKKPQVIASDRRLAAQHGAQPLDNLASGQHALGPADYAVIYNINPLYQAGITGTGTTIAVVGRSNINPQDVTDFRNFFGLSANDPQVIPNGPVPTPTDPNEELEADLDVEWSGAVAPSATIKFVVSASTLSTDGIDLSEIYIIDNNLGNVMTESFGGCEAALNGNKIFYFLLAEQAAAQGITYVVSAGDEGAEGCATSAETVATGPISVNILASTPFTVAVGGTMFNENGQDSKFWNSTNNPNNGSAISYIPEDVWNESCSASAPSCQRPNISAGGGGASILFSKPNWQTPGVTGIPNDGARDLPDVSLTAALHDPYLICIERSCSGEPGAVGPLPVGGTSAAAPSFAAIMALVNQKTGSRQGQADYVLYRLAAAETLSQCNGSNTGGLPASNCIFNDVTVGNNAVPGETGFGTSTASYQSGVGYDLATGLGSVNAANLANNWNSVTFTATATTLGISPTSSITHGTPVNINIAVAPITGTGTPTGDVSLLTSTGQSVFSVFSATNPGLPAGFFTLSGGSASSTTTLLPGGSYAVTAHYAGDGTFAASDSASVSVTVSPEASTAAVKVLAPDQNGKPTSIPFTTGPFGSPVFLFANVAGQSGNGTPTGTINFTDNGSPLAGNPFALNSEGFTITPNGISTFALGQHSISASYSGDASFEPSTAGPVNFTITPGFSVSANPATVNVLASGQSGSSTITLTAGGVTGPVSLTCSVSPVPVNDPPACSVFPFSVTLNATTTSATATLQITTTARLSSGLRPGNRPNEPAYFTASAGIVMICVFLLGAPKQRRRWDALLGLLVLVFVGLALTSCASQHGGSSKINLGTPSGNYAVTVTATSGGAAQSTTVALVVQ